MDNITLSVFGNKIFFEILKELNYFSSFKINYYDSLNFSHKNNRNNFNLFIYISEDINKETHNKFLESKYPIIIITKKKLIKNLNSSELLEYLNLPITILALEKKILFLFSKFQYKITSIINISGYIINKNRRTIKKNNLELKLTEKEINFLILFYDFPGSLDRKFILKKVWNYSSESDTHTVETHIHRLRKKILKKFNDSRFIKNNEKGYYI